ncbi:MAG: DUF488 family protein [Muribaculaceae bacterium]
MSSSIYSIGHGQKSTDEFISELRSFDIQYLIDVRSSPFSKWAPQYNQGTIEEFLKQNGIIYLYMGDVIGGRPLNDSCFDSDGYFDYKKMAEMPQFQAGLKRLVKANEKGCRVAVMCSEADPTQCHRSKLIGRELYFQDDISMEHIIAVNKTKTQVDIMTELDRGKGNWPEGDLFNEATPPYFKSRKSYKKEEQENDETLSYYD